MFTGKYELWYDAFHARTTFVKFTSSYMIYTTRLQKSKNMPKSKWLCSKGWILMADISMILMSRELNTFTKSNLILQIMYEEVHTCKPNSDKLLLREYSEFPCARSHWCCLQNQWLHAQGGKEKFTLKCSSKVCLQQRHFVFIAKLDSQYKST